MRFIQKNEAPESFKKYCKKGGASYKDLSNTMANYAIKQELKESLLHEQKFICCYCGNSIDITDSHIEHLKCKDIYPKLQLEYSNLLCSCNGGSADKKTSKHCGHKKNNIDIEISPLDSDCEDMFLFTVDGHIEADSAHSKNLDAYNAIKTLGLDCRKLKNMRKAALASITDEPWSIQLNYYRSITEDRLKPFCFVAIKYIELNMNA